MALTLRTVVGRNLTNVEVDGNFTYLDGRIDSVQETADDALTAAASAIPLSQKGAAGGVCDLDGSGLVPAVRLPSYVDDVLEYANLAAFPVTGATGKIYVALDTNKTYRWGGSAYIEISPSPGSTDAVPEGSTNLYFTTARVLATLLSGLSLATGSPIVASDSILIALGKLQKQITDIKPMTTLGDIIVGGASGVAQRLGIGVNGRVLGVVSGVPAWMALGGLNLYCTAGGSANAITLTPNYTPGTPTAYVAGDRWRAKIAATNTGATTVNVAGLGVKTAVTVTGVALPAGYIRTDVDTNFTYDAVNNWVVVDREPEYISNATGTGIRLANGYQKTTQGYNQSIAITTATGSLFIGSGTVVDFPVPFATTPFIVNRVWAAGSISVISGGRPVSTSATQAAFQAYATVSTTQTVSFAVEATGTWY